MGTGTCGYERAHEADGPGLPRHTQRTCSMYGPHQSPWVTRQWLAFPAGKSAHSLRSTQTQLLLQASAHQAPRCMALVSVAAMQDTGSCRQHMGPANTIRAKKTHSLSSLPRVCCRGFGCDKAPPEAIIKHKDHDLSKVTGQVGRFIQVPTSSRSVFMLDSLPVRAAVAPASVRSSSSITRS